MTPSDDSIMSMMGDLGTPEERKMPMTANLKDAELIRIGINKDGSPKHPLYVAAARRSDSGQPRKTEDAQ